MEVDRGAREAQEQGVAAAGSGAPSCHMLPQPLLLARAYAPVGVVDVEGRVAHQGLDQLQVTWRIGHGLWGGVGLQPTLQRHEHRYSVAG